MKTYTGRTINRHPEVDIGVEGCHLIVRCFPFDPIDTGWRVPTLGRKTCYTISFKDFLSGINKPNLLLINADIYVSIAQPAVKIVGFFLRIYRIALSIFSG